MSLFLIYNNEEENLVLAKCCSANHTLHCNIPSENYSNIFFVLHLIPYHFIIHASSSLSQARVRQNDAQDMKIKKAEVKAAKFLTSEGHNYNSKDG